MLGIVNEMKIESGNCESIISVLKHTANQSDNIFDGQSLTLRRIQNTSLDARQSLFNATMKLNFTKNIESEDGEMAAFPAIYNSSNAVYGNRSSNAVLIQNPNKKYDRNRLRFSSFSQGLVIHSETHWLTWLVLKHGHFRRPSRITKMLNFSIER